MPSTWPLESYSVDLVSSVLNCAHDEALRRRREFGKHHRDPAWLDQTVASLSVPALCVVAALVSRGGMRHAEDLETTLHAAYGLHRDDIHGGIQELFKLLLVVPLSQGSGRASLVALTESAADGLAARVVGIELVAAGTGKFVEDPAADGGRALLATVMALATAELRITTAGAPNRTGLKKLAKQVGLEPEVLEPLVIAAHDCGLLAVVEDRVLAPRLDRVLAASEGNYAATPTLDVLRALPHPVALDQISAFLTAARYRDRFAVASASLGMLPGFTAGKVGKVAAIASVAIAGTAAASVTPSFEVFLPPESRPRDLVEVLAACEVGRIDRAIVGRITKASINAAIGRGATADSLIAALAAATRTPLPQNVVAAIRDWAGNAVSATIAQGTVVVVAPSEEARAMTALAPYKPRVVAPGVLVVPGEVAERAIALALRKHGIFAGQPAPSAPIAAPTTERPAHAIDVLQARLVAYCRRDPSERRPAPPAIMTTHPPRQPPIEVVDMSASRAIAHRIERWENQHDEVFDPDAFELLIDLLGLLALPDRQFLFDTTSIEEFVGRLGEVLSRPDQLARLSGAMRDQLAELGCRLQTQQPSIEWHRDNILARLDAAARTRSSMTLDLGSRIVTVAITRLMTRGETLVVLGEDATRTNHAIRVEQIAAVAEAASVGPGQLRWRPVNGMKQPAGHVKCPCGSDKRYRECCRDPA